VGDTPRRAGYTTLVVTVNKNNSHGVILFRIALRPQPEVIHEHWGAGNHDKARITAIQQEGMRLRRVRTRTTLSRPTQRNTARKRLSILNSRRLSSPFGRNHVPRCTFVQRGAVSAVAKIFEPEPRSTGGSGSPVSSAVGARLNRLFNADQRSPGGLHGCAQDTRNLPHGECFHFFLDTSPARGNLDVAKRLDR
jgi:hypothetical protein